jgi:hypothetical protein
MRGRSSLLLKPCLLTRVLLTTLTELHKFSVSIIWSKQRSSVFNFVRRVIYTRDNFSRGHPVVLSIILK